MTEHEMLKLAAKAAGHEYIVHHLGGADYAISIGGPGWWNPREDSGQALRLAAKLDIDLMFGFHTLEGGEYLAASCACVSIEEPVLLDKLAATRLAITRAAAQIQLSKDGNSELQNDDD